MVTCGNQVMFGIESANKYIWQSYQSENDHFIKTYKDIINISKVYPNGLDIDITTVKYADKDRC